MRSRPNLSPTSAPCRFEWRPSRQLAWGLVGLTVLAVAAVWLSEAPRWGAAVATPLLLAASLHGTWRGYRRAPVRVVVSHGQGPVWVDGRCVQGFAVQWQGPLVIARWRGARSGCELICLPDNLPPFARRELYLAMRSRQVSQFRQQMAP